MSGFAEAAFSIAAAKVGALFDGAGAAGFDATASAPGAGADFPADKSVLPAPDSV